MKKNYLLAACVAILPCINYGCQDLEEKIDKPSFTRDEVIHSIIENPEARLAIWNDISIENQFAIWKSKIDHVSNQKLKREWSLLFAELKANFTYQMYQHALGDLNKMPFLVDWIDRFSLIATEDEKYFTIGSLFDYDASTNTILYTYEKGKDSPTIQSDSSDKIVNRDLPGTGSNCDCKWTNCGSDEYCCKPASTTGCTPTRTGCGFLWLQGCESFCLSGITFNCNNF